MIVFLSFVCFLVFSIVCCLYVICGVLHARVGERSCNLQINQKHFSTLASRTGDGVTSGQVLPDQNLIADRQKVSTRISKESLGPCYCFCDFFVIAKWLYGSYPQGGRAMKG